MIWKDCPWCMGTGKVGNDPCIVCEKIEQVIKDANPKKFDELKQAATDFITHQRAEEKLRGLKEVALNKLCQLLINL